MEQSAEGDFVHWSEIQMPGCKTLEVNQRVELDYILSCTFTSRDRHNHCAISSFEGISTWLNQELWVGV